MIVGKATKQPAETEKYSIYFDDDLDATENIVSAYHAIFNRRNVVRRTVAQETVASDYIAVAADVFKVFRTTDTVTLTLPVGLADGSEFYVANYSQSRDATVSSAELIDASGTYLLSVNRSAVLQRQSGTWVTLVSGTNVVIDSSTEHRVRIVFVGGEDRATYEVEVTADTDEGRRLQDELLITVKET